MKRIEIIDYLKGFSISTIVVMHLIQLYTGIPQWFSKLSLIGGTGVHVFVFCSGFGLLYSSNKKPIGYFDFIKKRFSSVYFEYIIVVLISALIPFMYRYDDRLQAVLSHVFLYKMFIGRYMNSFGGQMWFISMIFQFYFVFYILKYLYERLQKRKFFLLSVFLSVAWWIFIFLAGKTNDRVWDSFFLRYLWEFSLGMILADYYSKGNEIKFPSNFILLGIAVIGLATGGGMALMSDKFRALNDISLFCGYTALAVLLYRLGIGYIRSLFFEITKFSFEWYLTHIIVFSCIFRVPGVPWMLKIVISFILSIAVAILYQRAYSLIADRISASAKSRGA